MANVVFPPDSGRKRLYDRARAVPLKYLRSDGSIIAPDKSGVEVLPADPERAALWTQAPAEPTRFLFPDGSVHDIEPPSGNGGGGGIPEAPQDGVQYGRQNGAWTAIIGGTGDVPAENVRFADGENLQDKLNRGALGGAEWEDF